MIVRPSSTETSLGNPIKAAGYSGKLVLADGVKEIALIFVWIETFQQAVNAITAVSADIMTGGYVFGPEISRMVDKRFKLDLAVAQDIRIRGAPGEVVVDVGLDDMTAELLFHRDHVVRQTALLCYAARIAQVGYGGQVLLSETTTAHQVLRSRRLSRPR